MKNKKKAKGKIKHQNAIVPDKLKTADYISGMLKNGGFEFSYAKIEKLFLLNINKIIIVLIVCLVIISALAVQIKLDNREKRNDRQPEPVIIEKSINNNKHENKILPVLPENKPNAKDNGGELALLPKFVQEKDNHANNQNNKIAASSDLNSSNQALTPATGMENIVKQSDVVEITNDTNNITSAGLPARIANANNSNGKPVEPLSARIEKNNDGIKNNDGNSIKALLDEANNDGTPKTTNVSSLESLVETKKNKAYEVFLKGKEQADKGDISGSISFLEKAKSIYPEIPECLYYLGIAYCLKGDYRKGIDNLEWSYKLDKSPNILLPVKNAYFMYGLKNAKSGNFNEAVKLFTRVIEFDPKDTGALFNRGVCYSSEKQYQQALDDFNACRKLGVKSLDLSFVRAIAIEKTGNEEKALEEYKKIIEEQPLFASAHYNIAVLIQKKIKKGDPKDKAMEESIYHYKRSLEIDPSFHQAAFNICNIYFSANNTDLAIKWAKKTLELKNDFPEGHLFLLNLYKQAKQYNNALTVIEFMEKKSYCLADVKKIKEEIYQATGRLKPKKTTQN